MGGFGGIVLPFARLDAVVGFGIPSTFGILEAKTYGKATA
jgi:hypothetical protein